MLANVAGVGGALLICSLYLLIGSVMIFLSLLETFNLPSVLIELFWSAISVFGLVRSLGRKRQQASEAGLCPDPPKGQALWKPFPEAGKP